MAKTLWLAVLLCAAMGNAADVSGKWELTLTGGQIVAAQRLNLEAKDGKYQGNFQGMDLTGVVTDDESFFDCAEKGKPCGSMKGRIAGSVMNGDGTPWCACRRALASPDFRKSEWHADATARYP